MSRPWTSAARALSSTASATIDVFLAFISTAVVVALAIDAVNGAVGYPVSGEFAGSAATLAGIAATYPFASGAWSLDRFLDFAFTMVLTLLLVAVVLSFPLFFLLDVRTGSDIAGWLQFAFVAAAYVIAAVDVYWTPIYRI